MEKATICTSRKTFLPTIFLHPNIQQQSALRLAFISSYEAMVQSDSVADEAVLIDFYSQASAFLESDTCNKRMLLYFPFEFLPETEQASRSQDLQDVVIRFIATYMKHWHLLLSFHDVRANFVDGDILESDIPLLSFPRVCKAAHLIPVLLKKKYLAMEDIILLLKNNSDPVLWESVADGIPELQSEAMRAGKIQCQQRAACNETSEGRIAWEEKNRMRNTITHAATSIPMRGIPMLLASPDIISQRTGVESLRQHLELNTDMFLESCRSIANCFQETLLSLWRGNDPDLSEEIESLLLRGASVGIVSKEYLDMFDLNHQHLYGTSPEYLELERAALNTLAKSIAENAILSPHVYPVAILYGSKIKGYGSRHADTDIALFIKPDTDLEMKDILRAEIQKVFDTKAIKGNALEFWLKEEGQYLEIIDFPTFDPLIGDSLLPHVLFQGIWCGYGEAIELLQEKTAPPFLYSNNKMRLGRDARTAWLEGMEHDALLYRLLHKGYARFYVEHIDPIVLALPFLDLGTFWDSGYRKLATLLFLKKVFLPQLERQ
jgi:hypothetical protein